MESDGIGFGKDMYIWLKDGVVWTITTPIKCNKRIMTKECFFDFTML
jgi:hypothetical protein